VQILNTWKSIFGLRLVYICISRFILCDCSVTTFPNQKAGVILMQNWLTIPRILLRLAKRNAKCSLYREIARALRFFTPVKVTGRVTPVKHWDAVQMSSVSSILYLHIAGTNNNLRLHFVRSFSYELTEKWVFIVPWVHEIAVAHKRTQYLLISFSNNVKRDHHFMPLPQNIQIWWDSQAS